MTLAELRAAAFQEAGIVASGENVDAADDQLAAAKYSAMYDMLLSDGLVAWAATADVPNYADIPLTMMLAAAIAPAFGVTGQRLVDLRTGWSAAEIILRKQLAKNYVSYPVQSEYF